MKLTRRAFAMTFLAGTLATAGCSSPSTSSVGAPEGAEHHLSLAILPGQDIGLIFVPEVQKIFQDHRVNLTIAQISGTDAVDSVVSKRFDLAYSSYVPPILALAKGTDLRVISGLSNLGPAGANGSTLVRKDSGIKTWTDLAGKTVAVQSTQSYSALALQAAIVKKGGEATNLSTPVATPNGRISADLAAGVVNVGELLEPYAAQALGNYPDMFDDIGDAKEYVLGENTPLTAFYTTRETAKSNTASFTAFRTALDKAVEFGNAHPDAVKKGSAGQAGLSQKVALSLPTSVFGSSATANELKPIVDIMLKMKWIDKAPDLSEFAAG